LRRGFRMCHFTVLSLAMVGAWLISSLRPRGLFPCLPMLSRPRDWAGHRWTNCVRLTRWTLWGSMSRRSGKLVLAQLVRVVIGPILNVGAVIFVGSGVKIAIAG